jgi:hypothetical protein
MLNSNIKKFVNILTDLTLIIGYNSLAYHSNTYNYIRIARKMNR